MKRNALNFALVLAIIVGVISIFKAMQSDPLLAEKIAETKRSKFEVRPNSDVVSQDLDSEETFDDRASDDFLEGPVEALAPDANEKVIIHAGINRSEVIEVEGREIVEEPLTGFIMVYGLAKMRYPDGRIRRAHGPPDPMLWFDPKTGEVSVSVNNFFCGRRIG